MKAWTDAERERYRRTALARRPWEKSTGPRTAKGKRTVSRNALKHGLYAAERLRLRAYLRSVAALLAAR